MARPLMDESLKTNLLIPVRFSAGEKKKLQVMMRKEGELYMTRMIRRLVYEAMQTRKDNKK